MKEVAKIERFSISRLYANYYVFETIDGVEYYDGWFGSLKEALQYVETFIK